MESKAVLHESLLFKPLRDAYGQRLALVFGNEFAGGECPFYTAGQCSHCDIGAGEGFQFNLALNKERLEFFKQHYRDVLPNTAHLVVYNSGSVLNPREMSRETLKNILEYIASLQSCRVISLDSREQYITRNSLEHILENIRDDQQPRVIMGIESQADDIRIGKLNKRMLKENVEKAFRTVRDCSERIGIDFNIVFQSPCLVGGDAINDSLETLKYGLNLSEKYGVSCDFNFHPYYPSRKSKILYPSHPRANLYDAKKALIEMKHEIAKRQSQSYIFVGWQDESHDQEQTMRQKELANEIEAFDSFNVSQNTSYLKEN